MATNLRFGLGIFGGDSMTDDPNSNTTDQVRRQYDAHPYPMRNPEDERHRLLHTSLDDLAALNFYCFGGRCDFRSGFRVLVAGGGSGDALISLAQQLRRTDATIVYLDLSEEAMRVARERACVRGLDEKIEWLKGSLLDLPSMGLGTFDYINCSGVLHHLDDPANGLRALKSVLKDDGAMGLMLYGQYGRTGLYQMQRLMRLVNQNESDLKRKIKNARAVIEAAPNTNWLKRRWGDRPISLELDDDEIVDRFLHPKDRAYTIPQLYELLDQVGLHLVEFTGYRRMFYDPRYVFPKDEILAKILKLDRREEQAVVEIFHGSIAKHVFWASPLDNTQLDFLDPTNVPFFIQSAVDDQAQKAIVDAKQSPWTIKIGPEQGVKIGITINPTPVTQRFVELIDGRRSTGQIIETIRDEGVSTPASLEAIRADCQQLMNSLLMCDLISLRRPTVQPLV